MIRNLLLIGVALLLPLQAAEKRCLLGIFSHPDDEMSVGPLLAKYAKAGHVVYLVAITSGQKGVTAHANLPAGDQLGAAREEELRCAAKNLGIKPPILLQFQDQGISTLPVMEQVAGRLREVIQQTKPQVLITWGPDGVTGHPDHRATSVLVSQVFQQRALLQHQPQKLYYVVSPESKAPKAPPFGRLPFHTVSDIFITTEVNGREWLDAAYAAVECHKTQWDQTQLKRFKEVSEKIFEGHVFLRLALSEKPPRPGRRETDIFAGIR